MSDEVLVERDGAILVITMNRPQARNAVNRAMSEAIAVALDELDGDPVLTVAVLTGAGGTFSSGMDLKAFLAGENVMVPGRGLAGFCIQPPRKPLIAAVEGFALAGGCEIAVACDMIVAAENAQFGIPEVKRGLVAGSGGLLRLPRRVPSALAMEWALTGDPISAVDAHRIGLVNKVTPPGGALAAARELAARIGANGPLAVAATKEILVNAPDWPMSEAWTEQENRCRHVYDSADAQEGARAFAEKRAPVWKGR